MTSSALIFFSSLSPSLASRSLVFGLSSVNGVEQENLAGVDALAQRLLERELLDRLVRLLGIVAGMRAEDDAAARPDGRAACNRTGRCRCPSGATASCRNRPRSPWSWSSGCRRGGWRGRRRRSRAAPACRCRSRSARSSAWRSRRERGRAHGAHVICPPCCAFIGLTALPALAAPFGFGWPLIAVRTTT